MRKYNHWSISVGHDTSSNTIGVPTSSNTIGVHRFMNSDDGV
jgi:hypothetical protein